LKKLKVILLFSCLVVLIRTYFITNNNIYNSKYNINTSVIDGYIINHKIDGNKLNLEIKGKEKIYATYYFNSLNEKNNYINNIKIGDVIRIKGEIREPPKNRIRNGFNYNLYLKSKKIYYVFSAKEIKKISSNKKINYKIKNCIINRINSINNNYLYTFIIGDTSVLDNEIVKTYRNNGISHLFAVSGMHVTLLAFIILFVLNKVSSNKYINNSIVFIFLFFYMFLTNFTPSIIRSVFFFILLSFNKIFKIKIKPLYILIIVLLMLLIYNPYYIYNIGFILSFLTSFVLIICTKTIKNYNSYLNKTFIISLLCFLICMPVIINNYNQINLLSPIINVFFVPFISLIVFPFAIITFIFPFFKDILFILTDLVEKISIYIDHIKYFNIILKTVPMYIFITYYIIIIFIIKKLEVKKYIYLLILVIILVIHSNINYLNNYTKITIIDVGQGDSILISLPKNKGNILIDTGGIKTYQNEIWQKQKNKYSIADKTIIPYLKSEGIKKLDYLVLTHGDNDHMGEATNLVENFKVDKVIFNVGYYNELEKELIKILDIKKINYIQGIEELNIENNKFYFLNSKIYDNENDNSNVIYFNYNNNKFLFMGDAGIEREKDILGKYNLKDIDFLKVGHHGSNSSSGQEFINSINPKYSLILVGENNRYGHPKDSVLDTLAKSKIYRTDLDGSIEIKLNNKGYKVDICCSQLGEW